MFENKFLDLFKERRFFYFSILVFFMVVLVIVLIVGFFYIFEQDEFEKRISLREKEIAIEKALKLDSCLQALEENNDEEFCSSFSEMSIRTKEGIRVRGFVNCVFEEFINKYELADLEEMSCFNKEKEIEHIKDFCQIIASRIAQEKILMINNESCRILNIDGRFIGGVLDHEVYYEKEYYKEDYYGVEEEQENFREDVKETKFEADYFLEVNYKNEDLGVTPEFGFTDFNTYNFRTGNSKGDERTNLYYEAGGRYGIHSVSVNRVVSENGYDWTMPETTEYDLVSITSQNKIEVIPRIHPTGSTKGCLSLNNINCARERYELSDEELWKDFLRKMVREFGDKINYYRIENEPEYGFLKLDNGEWDSGTKEFVRTLKIAYEVIKEENPNAKVSVAVFNSKGYPENKEVKDYLVNNGIISSQKLNENVNNPYKGIQALMELGAGDYFDVLAVHYYEDYREVNGRWGWYWRDVFMEDYLSEVRKTMKDKGYEKPIMITEFGIGTSHAFDSNYENEVYTQSENIVKQHVIAFSENISPLLWLTFREKTWGYLDVKDAPAVSTMTRMGITCSTDVAGNSYNKIVEDQNKKVSISYYTGTDWICSGLMHGNYAGIYEFDDGSKLNDKIKSSYYVYQDMTQIFENTRFAQKIINGKTKFYVFDKGNQLLIVAWTDESLGKKSVEVLGKYSEVKIYNSITGNEESFEKEIKENSIVLNNLEVYQREPIYILVDKKG
jgi:hypothetical protein